MKLKDLFEKSHKVDETIDKDIDIKIEFVDTDTDEVLHKFIGDATVVGIQRYGTTEPYSSEKYGDDSFDEIEDNYDDAELEISKETKHKVDTWLKANHYTIEDQDYVEFNLEKGNVELGYFVKKAK